MTEDTRVHHTYYVALVQAFAEVARLMIDDETPYLECAEFSPGVTLGARLASLVERARELGVDVRTSS